MPVVCVQKYKSQCVGQRMIKQTVTAPLELNITSTVLYENLLSNSQSGYLGHAWPASALSCTEYLLAA